MASQRIETSGGFAGEKGAISTPRESSAASNDANHHPADPVRREAAGPRRADRISFRGRLVARIGAVALELGEYLCPSISTISAITTVCERLTIWAGSDDRHGPDAVLASFDRRAKAKRAAVEPPSLQVDAHARRSLSPQPVACGSLPSSQIRL
jgi:hypothetical protein